MAATVLRKIFFPSLDPASSLSASLAPFRAGLAARLPGPHPGRPRNPRHQSGRAMDRSSRPRLSPGPGPARFRDE